MQSRREFVKTVGVLAAGAMLPRRAVARWDEPKSIFARQSVPGGGFVLGSLTDGGNVLIMPSSAGTMVVDAKYPYHGPDVLVDTKALLKGDPTLLIHTHHHVDHAGGTWAFPKDIRSIARKNCNARMELDMPLYVSQADGHVAELKRSGADEVQLKLAEALAEQVRALTPENFKAKETVDHHLSTEHGDLSVELFHYDAGHTDNDLVIFLPKQNIMHMGDLLFNDLHPYVDAQAGANTKGWQDAIRQVMPLANDKTVIIPGHGKITDKSALQKQIDYFEILHKVVYDAILNYKTREEVMKLRPEGVMDRGFEKLLAPTLGAIFDELENQVR